MKRTLTFLMTALFLCMGMTVKAQTFPETSTAEAPKYYTIASFNRGGYLTNVGNGKGVEHVATTKGSIWYFTKADENGGLHFCNYEGGYLAADKTISETAGTWYVLANGVNTEGVSISSTNPISSGSCIDANNSNTGVGSWHPSANDWEGTTWVFAEVDDIYAYFKDQAKAELDVLASASSIYPDATEAKAAIDALEIEDIEQLNATLAQCVADYKNAAYQALEGKYFTINTPARPNGFMKLDGNRVVGLAEASSPATVWQFVHADNAVKVFNPYTGKYLGEPGENSTDVPVTANAEDAAAYQLVINDKAEKAEAKVKFTSNGKSVHMAGGSVLVRWNDGGASEWTVVEISEFSGIVSLHKAAALAAVDAYSALPEIFETAAAKEAINAVSATDWSAFAAVDEAANKAIPTGTFAFQATSSDNHRDSVWVSANMETSKAIGAVEQDENAHWTLKPANGGAFYIYNVKNGLYMGNPGGNCALTESPVAAYTIEVIDAEKNVVEFKCAGETLHASNHNDDKLMHYDGDEAASRWTIVAIVEEPTPDPDPTPDPEEPEVDESDYDLTEGTWSDATTYLVNPDFASLEGWTYAWKTNYDGGRRVMEFYAGWGALEQTSASIKQNVDLLAGTYRLSGNAFFRYGRDEFQDNSKSLGKLVAGDNFAYVAPQASEGNPGFGDADKFFYTQGKYNVGFEFTLDAPATVAIGYEAAFEEVGSWFVVGALTLEKKQTLKDNFMEQAAAFSAFGQSSMALNSLDAVQEKWAEAMAVVDPLYGALAEGGKALKAEVVAAMELMTTTMAEIKPVVEYYDGKFTDTKWAMDDIQENSTANSDEVRAAFDDALAAALNVSAVTTVAELEAKVAEMEAARQAYVLNAVPAEGYPFDMTFKIVNAAVTSAEGWTNAEGRIINNTEYTGAPDKAAFDAGWWAGVIDIHQELPELPAGNYVLSAVARSASPDSYIYAKSGEAEVKTTLPQNGDQGGEFGNGWATVTADTINVVEGESLTIGVYINNPGTNFAAADNFKLYYAGTVVEEPEQPEVDPNDYTSYVKNADLSVDVEKDVADAGNWNTVGTKGISGGMVKVGGNTFNFCQTITLPAGQYKMTAKAAYRYANNTKPEEQYEYEAILAGKNTHLAKLYAETSSYKYEANVKNRWEGASDTNFAPAGENVSTVNGKFVPNSSNAVKAWFDNGMYVNELVFNVQEEGEVKIGIAKAENCPDGDYTNIGAWTLTRLGDAEADPEVEEPEQPETPEEPGEITNVDCTDKVNKNGWICENGKPNGVTIDGIAMQENFQDGQTSTSASTTGVVLWQDVTGLENGNYTVELWANARVAWQDSPATDGQEELTYLVANNVEISMKVFLNPGLNNNATYVLEGVEVTDGTLHIEMNKKAAGSNWHSIQIKSLTLHVSNNEALKLAKADLQAALESAAAVSPSTETLTAAIAAAQSVYDNSKSVDEVNATVAALKNATILAINTNSVAGATLIAPVATDFVVNGTFDNEIAPWQSTTGAQNQALATNQQGAFTGRFFENWNPSNYTGKLYQVIENIPNGLYELSICAFANNYKEGAHYVYANADKKALTTGAPTAYTILTVVTDNTIEVGLEQIEAVNEWMGIDNVSLKYFGEMEGGSSMAFISYEITKANAQALTTEKMASATLDVLNAAIAKEVDTTSDEALVAAEAEISAAINAAKQSIQLFASNKVAIDAMFTLMNSTNVYTVEAYDTYKAKAEDFLVQYEAGTLTTTVDNPATIHGWRASVDYDDFLLSAFGVKDFDTNLYINTWSGEGENDGSEFKVPFFEYWVGDGESLGATTKTATVTGLTPGMCYTAEAWVRVRAKNGVAAADATGITLSVGEGEATDVTEGEVIGTSQFSHAVFTATGVADAEGNLTINFNILEGNNVSWLSFKNVKYTEVEVVEPEYLTVVGAKVGDVALVEGMATVESISTIDVTFDRPVALAENAGWATLADSWGPTNLDAEVLEENNCVVRFTVSQEFFGEFTEAGDYYLNIPEGFIVGAEGANFINAAIEAVITIEAAPATPLIVTNVTVGEDVMEGFTVVATPEDMIKVNFDGQFYFQGMPSIVDAEGNDASASFTFANGLDVDGSNSYIFQGMNAGTYTITMPKASFMNMMQWKAPAEDIVLTVEIVVEPEYLTVVGAKVGDVALVEGMATVESISTIDVTFDRPVALAENAGWATLADSWGPTNLDAEVLEENNCVVRFTVSQEFFGEFTEAGDYYLNIPEGFIVGAEDANYINATIEAVITIEAAPVTPLTVVNVTVGEDVMEGFTVVATTEDKIKVNFDGEFYFQGMPSIVDAEGNDASASFTFANGIDVDGSNSYIFQGMNAGTYTITMPKASFLNMMQWKAPAEDIVLTVEITFPVGIQNIEVDADAVIYDLSGRRVNVMTKGIYIVNGKKVIKK